MTTKTCINLSEAERLTLASVARRHSVSPDALATYGIRLALEELSKYPALRYGGEQYWPLTQNRPNGSGPQNMPPETGDGGDLKRFRPDTLKQLTRRFWNAINTAEATDMSLINGGKQMAPFHWGWDFTNETNLFWLMWHACGRRQSRDELINAAGQLADEHPEDVAAFMEAVRGMNWYGKEAERSFVGVVTYLADAFEQSHPVGSGKASYRGIDISF